VELLSAGGLYARLYQRQFRDDHLNSISALSET